MKEKRFYLADFMDSVDEKPIWTLYIILAILIIYLISVLLSSHFLFEIPDIYPEEEYKFLEDLAYAIINHEEKYIDFTKIPQDIKYEIISTSSENTKITLEKDFGNYFNAFFTIKLNSDFEITNHFRNCNSLEDYKHARKMSAYVASIPITMTVFFIFIFAFLISKCRKELYLKKLQHEYLKQNVMLASCFSDYGNQKKSNQSILIKASKVLSKKKDE